MSDKNANAQVAEMQRLSQAAAAWLAGISPRSIRDVADLPRAADGTYNARDVVKWATGRTARPELTDDEFERLIVVAEQISPLDDGRLPAMLAAIDELKAKHGDAVLLTLVERVFLEWWEQVEEVRRAESNEAAHRKAAEFQRKYEAEQAARRELRIVVVCEHCGRRRHGRKWVKSPPPSGFAKIEGICPGCERRV